MKKDNTLIICAFFLLLSIFSFSQNLEKNKNEINNTLNQWHKDVADSNFDAYFNKMTSNSVFVCTDASEVWSKQKFKEFAKSFFNKKETWNFTSINRNIYFSSDQKPLGLMKF